MAGSFRTDLRLAGWLRRRQLAPRYAFWLLLLGYDVRERSKGDWLYVPYLVVFWAVWGLIVSFGIADFLAGFLRSTGGASETTIILLLVLVIAAWVLFRLRAAVWRSPLVFNENDAQLLCQSPLSRQAVAITWLIGDWPFRVAPWAAVAILLGFTLAELQGLDTASEALQYAALGLRGFSVMVPLHLALFSAIWAIGVYRLQDDRRRPWVRRLPAALAGYFLLSLIVVVLRQGWSPGELSDVGWLLLWSLVLPLRAAFADLAWWMGFALVVVGAAVALLLYIRTSRRLNLSRAAQESQRMAAGMLNDVDSIVTTGASTNVDDYAGAQSDAQRPQPAPYSASPPRTLGLSPGAGWRSVIWLDSVTWLRTSTLSDLLPWIFLAVISAAAVLVPLFAIRAIAIFVWVQQVGGHTTHRLRRNLTLWWLYGQLPLAPGRLLLVEAAGSVASILLVTGAGAWVGWMIEPADFAVLFGLLPIIIPGVALAHEFDVLRRNRDGQLLSGDVATAGYLGLGLGLAATVAPGLLFWGLSYLLPVWLALSVATAVGLILCYALWRAARAAFRQVG